MDNRLLVPCLAPGAEGDVGVEIRTPKAPGHYSTHWQLVDDKNEPMGLSLWADYVVEAAEKSPFDKMVDEMTSMGYDSDLCRQLLSTWGSIEAALQFLLR